MEYEIIIDLDKCNGCEECVEICPSGCFEMVDNKATIIIDDCVWCESCIEVCEPSAISMEIVEDVIYVMGQWIAGGKKTQILIFGYCGVRNCPTLTGGHGSHFLEVVTAGVFTGVSWAYNAGANLTVGYLTLDANDEQIFIGFDLPDLLKVDGVQANFTIEVEMDAVNATDRFDYAIYTSEGVKLEEGVDQSIGTAAKDWIMLGSGQGDHLTKGDSLILFLGNFETNIGGNTTVSLYRIRITYKIAVESI